MNHRLHRFQIQITQIFLVTTCCLLLATLIGCEAFTRKFVRKAKKESVLKDEPVLVPEDYSLSDIPTEERYRQYFLFWKSWQDELISALGSSQSHKRIKTCIREAIKNLEEIRPLLFEEKQKGLDNHLGKLRQLENDINEDSYGIRLTDQKGRAESLKRNILRDFSYSVAKNHLR